MGLSGEHTSAKAADVAKLLLLSERLVTAIIPRGVRRCPDLTLTLTGLPQKANGFFRLAHVPPFHRIL